MEEDQEKYLEEARRVVREQAYYMRSALDMGKLRDALKYSSAMLSELKTSLLGPKNYYILFMQIFDEMRVLEAYFREEYKRGRKMNDLYETVQHAGNIIPRLYLLVTVGSVFIQTMEAPAKAILTDLLEMIKGVQHPLRGLFLRYYFLKMCKDRLPDKGSEYEGEGGDVNDALHCILTNLLEMNKLWTRMAHTSKDKAKREKERIDLKQTIGENIVRLSNLNGVNLEVYSRDVLPKLIEMINNTKDGISQQYLMECIIQAFPDEYHLNNLQLLLTTCTGLLAQVDVKLIFIKLMDRLSDFISNPDNQFESLNKSNLDIFALFRQSIDQVYEKAEVINDLRRHLDLQVAFLRFSLQCYPEETDYVNQILKSSISLIEQYNKTVGGSLDEESLKNIVKLLTIPLDTLSITILTMNEYPNLMRYLHFGKRKQVAISICRAVVTLRANLNSPKITSQLITFIAPLLKDDPDSIETENPDFVEEQQLVARVVHLVTNEDPAVVYDILELFKERFLEGELKRMRYTIPAFILALIRLTGQLQRHGESRLDFKTLFTSAAKLIEKLTANNPELCIRLYLQLALAVSSVDKEKSFDEFTYELISQALLLYEENVTDAEAKKATVQYITAAVINISSLSEENYDTLIANTMSYCSKLLKKPDQCLAVLNATHLFVNNHLVNEAKMFNCFKKCLQTAEVSVNSNIRNLLLYVHILNKFLYFLARGQGNLKPDDLQYCVKLIQEKLIIAEKEKPDNLDLIKKYFSNTKSYLQAKKAEGKLTEIEV